MILSIQPCAARSSSGCTAALTAPHGRVALVDSRCSATFTREKGLLRYCNITAKRRIKRSAAPSAAGSPSSSFSPSYSPLPAPRPLSRRRSPRDPPRSPFRIASSASSSSAGDGAPHWTDDDAVDDVEHAHARIGSTTTNDANATAAAENRNNNKTGRKKRLALGVAVFLLVTAVAAGGCSSVLAAMRADPKLSLDAAVGVGVSSGFSSEGPRHSIIDCALYKTKQSMNHIVKNRRDHRRCHFFCVHATPRPSLH